VESNFITMLTPDSDLMDHIKLSWQ